MTTPAARVLNRARHAVGRAGGSLFAARHGWFFVVRRWMAGLLGRVVVAGPPPRGYSVTSLDGALAQCSEARVRSREPGFPVLEIPGGVVIGPRGHVGTTARSLVPVIGQRGVKITPRLVIREAAAAVRAGEVHLPGVTANLVQYSRANYCFWLVLGVARLDRLIRDYGVDGFDRILVAEGAPGVFREALALYGIDPAKVMVIPERPTVYRCDVLVALGMPGRPGHAPPWAVELVRARFLSNSPIEAKRRLYVGRGVANRRRVVNEVQVIEMLTRRGFEEVAMDGLTVTEQAELWASAECVVAPHGAALANVVFANPGTPIVELLPVNYASSTFARLCDTSWLRYVPVLGTEPCLPWWVGRLKCSDADLVADVDALGRALDGTGIR